MKFAGGLTEVRCIDMVYMLFNGLLKLTGNQLPTWMHLLMSQRYKYSPYVFGNVILQLTDAFAFDIM